MDGLRGYHMEWSKSEREKQIPYINTYVKSKQIGIDNFTYEREIETQT